MKKKFFFVTFCIILIFAIPVSADNEDSPQGFFGKLFFKSFSRGCYLKIPGEKSILIAASKKMCRSYNLAFKYANTKDALRLVLKQIRKNPALHNKDVENILINEINADKEVEYTVGWGFKRMKRKIKVLEYSDYCQNVKVFGINTYCFNGIKDENGRIKKENNLASAVAPLVFLKMSGTEDMVDALTGETIEPFDFLIKEKIEILDATNQEALDDTLNAKKRTALKKATSSLQKPKELSVPTKCDRGIGSAYFNFMTADLSEVSNPYSKVVGTAGQLITSRDYEPGLRFVPHFCKTDGLENRIHYAGIFFHEGHHKIYGSHVHGIADPLCRKEWPCWKRPNDPECPPYDDTIYLPQTYDGLFGDASWESVQGAHVKYLFEASQNELLTDEERIELYQEAAFIIHNKMCGMAHDYPYPIV